MQKGEIKMSISDEIQAKLAALSIQSTMGQNVSEEVKRLIKMCNSEEDKKLAIKLCQMLGLDYGG